MTLAKALRMRTTIAKKIKLAESRAINSAISVSTDPDQDFNTIEQIAEFDKNQRDLRELKVRTAAKSINTKVLIPEDIPTDEAGKEVPVFCAVLIRDDLKSKKIFIDRLIGQPITVDMYMFDREKDPPTKKRNFNFDEAVELSEKLQEAIDTMDGIVQGTDATTKFE